MSVCCKSNRFANRLTNPRFSVKFGKSSCKSNRFACVWLKSNSSANLLDDCHIRGFVIITSLYFIFDIYVNFNKTMNKAETTEFIEVFKELPCLWNVKLPSYLCLIPCHHIIALLFLVVFRTYVIKSIRK